MDEAAQGEKGRTGAWMWRLVLDGCPMFVSRRWMSGGELGHE